MKRTTTRCGWLVGLALSLAAGGAWAEEVIDRVVCVVDDDAILLSEIERQARPFLTAMPSGLSAPQRAQQRAEALRTTLDRMLDDRLMRRAAARAHVTVTEDDVDEFIGRMAAERGATPEQVYAALQQEGVSRAEYRAYMESEVLQLRVLQQRVRGRINVTEADLQQAYRRAVREAADQTVPGAAPQPVEPPPFVSVRDRIYAALVNSEMLRQRAIYLRELRRTASIDDRLDLTRASR